MVIVIWSINNHCTLRYELESIWCAIRRRVKLKVLKLSFIMSYTTEQVGGIDASTNRPTNIWTNQWTQ